MSNPAIHSLRHGLTHRSMATAWSRATAVSFAAVTLLILSSLLGGCRSAPSGDLDVLRTQRRAPDIRDIDKLEQDYAYLQTEKVQVAGELDQLRATVAPTEYQVERIDYRRQRLTELAAEFEDLRAREAAIIGRLAGDQTQSREVFEQLEARLAPLSARQRGIEQERIDRRASIAADSPWMAAADEELGQLRRRIEYYETWEDRIAAAGTGYDRASGRGWPVLDGAAERRREARMGSGSEQSSSLGGTRSDDGGW